MTLSLHVLGAGFAGICCAIELRRRGFAVTLVDRGAPARETSYGNAGVIAHGSILPEASSEVWRRLPEYLFNLGVDVHLHYGQLPRMLPYIFRFLLNTRPGVYRRNARALCTLLDRSVDSHLALIEESGAQHLVQRRGWLKLYRTEAKLNADRGDERLLEENGVEFIRLDPVAINDLEPDLKPVFIGGRWINGVASVNDPGALGDAYTALFRAMGGAIANATVRGLEPRDGGWRIVCDNGALSADVVVLAMGAWSRTVLAALGYRVPLIPERGYHQNYDAEGEAVLSRPIHDIEGGYVLAPMAAGYRLTTGAEWARLDAKPTPVQLERVLPLAQEAFALGAPCSNVWLGNRPQTPDSLPLIGKVPGQERLWVATGHGHLGLSLGPITGRLLAAQIAGDRLEVDMAAFDPARFR